MPVFADFLAGFGRNRATLTDKTLDMLTTLIKPAEAVSGPEQSVLRPKAPLHLVPERVSPISRRIVRPRGRG